jgi:superfamily II DNA helicase RecQ
MTPQTLQNDLLREVVDARDIILLVVDEAHKATGNYAYATVVRYLMAKNPHFRVLALTATPGSKPETVQEIIDSLHIGHIEIRDEQSLDLKQYIYEKVRLWQGMLNRFLMPGPDHGEMCGTDGRVHQRYQGQASGSHGGTACLSCQSLHADRDAEYRQAPSW